jgi:hypothetical protein
MKAGEIKYKFSIKVLEEQLKKEKGYLGIFGRPEPIRYEDGPCCNIEECKRFLEWQKANVESCQHRINELEETIKFLKTILTE